MLCALALETSGRIGSVALVEDGRVVAADQFSHGLQHAAGLLPMIDRLTTARGWKPPDIAEIYVSAGPGSFTGLRIGITLAKTIAMATGAKLVAVPTMRVLLMNAPPEAEEVILVLDAKRGQIYTARYVRRPSSTSGLMDEWTEAESAHLNTLGAMIDRSGRPVYLLGEGIPYHKAAATGEGVFLTDESAWRARAENVAALGGAMAGAGQFIKPDEFLPIYVRLPEAEEKRLAATTAGR
ncbi:MAG TPA: tRNA (adenosine(37)-N6)-threonylcarbamoyltransferase complex dimerization subunit type 1 TsaB [Tepidisphaeraceae bacterium]|jgi:tRNA threonylcarbamoyladenosine biosynthesis protein TsaB